MKKVLVTGGAGFIGSAVVSKLQRQGHEVFVIDNLSFGNRNFIQVSDSNFFNRDILDSEKITEIVNGINPHWLIHLAAVHFIPYCNQHPYESANINIQGTINILKSFAVSKNPEKLFFASTAAVYPIWDTALSETVKPGPMDIYGLSKLTGEHLCHEFYLDTKIPVICCRFFNAFGPNETNPHLIPEIEKQIKEGKRTIALGNLTPKRDFIHTYDMANAVEALMINDFNGMEVFNLGRGIEYSVTEIVESFERQLGQKIHINVDPARVRKVERMHLLADISKLSQRTGWKPTWTIDEGIKTLIAH